MKVLFVCTANVCRSPLAEGYLKSIIEAKGISAVEAHSAGIAALTGRAPFDCALDTAKQNGFDISPKKAEQVTREMIEEADFVLCMETWQASMAMQLAPGSVDKIALLGSYHPQGQPLFQIRDPAAFRLAETLKTFELIKQAVDGFVASALAKS